MQYRSPLLCLVGLVLALSLSACATGADQTIPFQVVDSETIAAGERSSSMLTPRDSINPKDGSPYRVYEIALEQDQLISLSVDTSDFSPILALYTPEGDLLGRTSTHPYEMQRSSRLIRRVTGTGKHLIVISSASESDRGAFELHAEVLGESAEGALPGTVQGHLYGGARRSHPFLGGPLAVFPIFVGEEQAYSITVQSSDFDPYLAIVDAETEEILAESYGYVGEPAHILTELGAGAYEIWASTREESGDGRFRLSMETTEILRTETLVLGTTYHGFLGAVQQQIPREHHRRGHAIPFSLDEDATLDALMSTDQFDAYLYLTDSDGVPITEDDDSGGGLDARIIWPLEAGDYILWASSYNGDETGPFRLETSLREMTEAGEISMDSTISDSLSQANHVYPQRGTFIQYFTFEVESEGPIQIDLQSNDFDTYLVLEDAAGRLITENDDAHMGTTDSQIIHTLSPGSYRIGVTSFREGEVGSFTLEVQRAAPSGSSV
jgi:hypothetical protein